MMKQDNFIKNQAVDCHFDDAEREKIKGRVHSIQSLGTVDGPGVRFVVFFQGCPLRCSCCHNPDTWEIGGGTEYTADEIVKKALRYKEYFGKDGGITLSGGEPLIQPFFAYEIFRLCKENGISTCLDTSGCGLNFHVEKLLGVTDRVLLDMKYTNDEDYVKYVGCHQKSPLEFLQYLQEKGIPTTLRQVIIPTINDSEENISKLSEIVKKYTCIEKTELLPFRKICVSKYEAMGKKFPFEHIREANHEMIENLYKLL